MTESTTDRPETQTSSWLRFSVGMLAGAGIAAVDNFAFAGEVSPILIVAILLLCSGLIGAIWGTRGFSVSAIVWAWLPMTHVGKQVFHLPDTLHPNTYFSILKLALFTFFVTAIGFGFGLLLHRVLRREAKILS